MHRGDKKIEVCFIAPKAYPLFNPDAKNVKDPFGGSEVDLYLLALELAKDKNFQVSFITANYGQESIETIKGVRLIKTVDFKKNPLIGAIKVWLGLRRADAQIYFQEAVSWGTFLVALFCKFHGRTFIYRTASRYECDGTHIKRHPILGSAFKFSLRTAKLVFTQNRTDRENLQRTTGVCSVFMRNGHYIDKLRKRERDIILWVGRSTTEKRPELFVDLAQQIPYEKFVMICPRALGDDKYQQLISRTRTIENLDFIPQVPFSQINDFFQRAKVFVCTSQREGFPNTYIQACICETPILSLSVNPDGFLDKYNCGICCNNERERLIDSLKALLAENSYVELGRNARKYVEEHHDVAKIIEQYKGLFEQFVSNN